MMKLDAGFGLGSRAPILVVLQEDLHKFLGARADDPEAAGQGMLA